MSDDFLALVRWRGMSARPVASHPDVTTPEGFSIFYRANGPTVYGYLVRLCGGDRALAEDLTQETWLALMRELARGRTERADVRWLLTVARTRYLDHARRRTVHLRRLRLVRAETAGSADDLLVNSDVLDVLEQLEPAHRVVLLLRYVEDLPVPDVARAIGRTVTATNSLLARARVELRRRSEGSSDA
jgi:RNA polymerase sigma-70 factor, ECF subfamily